MNYFAAVPLCIQTRFSEAEVIIPGLREHYNVR